MQTDRWEISAGKGNRFLIRLNPWDEAAFGFKISEVFDLECADPKFMQKIDEENRRIGASLCCLRHPANDLNAKKNLLEIGFYPSENSFELSALLSLIKTHAYFQFRKTREADIEALTALAADNFHFSRFHQDPFLDSQAAVERYRNWVRKLAVTPFCLVAENEAAEIVGFFAYEQEQSDIRLQLAGISSQFRGAGYFFFSSIIESIKTFDPSPKIIRALVSAANLDVINIYSKLNFSFSKSLIDYHKRY